MTINYHTGEVAPFFYLDHCRLEVFLWKHSGDEPVERLRRLLKNLGSIFIPARFVFS